MRVEEIEINVSFPPTLAEVRDAIGSWGRRLETADEVEPLAARIEAEIAALESWPPPGTLRYAYWIWSKP